MCVIIFIPMGKKISEDELKKAWKRNSDGGGYCYQHNNSVIFKRGIMEFEEYKKQVMELMGKYNLLLHMRITTSKIVNRVQCHPYRIDNVKQLEGRTKSPVVCMNGTIHGQTLKKDCNDTMSYIMDYYDTFKILNQDIIDLIQDSTESRWACMTGDNVLLSSDFINVDGIWYSNRKHMYTYVYKPVNDYKTNYKSINKNKKSKKSTKSKTRKSNNTRSYYLTYDNDYDFVMDGNRYKYSI